MSDGDNNELIITRTADNKKNKLPKPTVHNDDDNPVAKCHGTRTAERLRGARRGSTDDSEARRVVDGRG